MHDSKKPRNGAERRVLTGKIKETVAVTFVQVTLTAVLNVFGAVLLVWLSSR
ncbi:hypothetical protein ACWEQO_33320 [Streptomyces sp. NPDC004051]